MSIIVPHSIKRALERYGLRLSLDDLNNIVTECQKGYGRLSYLPDGKERHLVMVHGKAVVLIYAPYDGTTVFQKMGRVITILPPEAARPGAQSSPATSRNKVRLRPPRRMPRKRRQRGAY